MKIDVRAQLRDKEDLYQNSPCGLVSFHMNGKIIAVNQTLLKWLEMLEETVVQGSFTDLIDKGGQFYYQLFVQPMLAVKQEVKEINISLKTPSGGIACLFNASVTISADGEKIVHAAIFRMDERKKYEVELLRKKVKAENEKQQKVAVLEEVAFNQSHMVRLPLANILGLISLVDKSTLNDENKKLFTLMEQSAIRLDLEIKKIVDKTVL